MKTRKLGLLAIIFASLVMHSSFDAAGIKISVGPNVRVGPEKTRQAEPFVAAHPVDSQNLIISASEIVDGLKGQGLLSRSYVSDDGGQTWEATELPGQHEALVNGRVQTELDNWILIAPNGEAYYTDLPFTSKETAPILVFRSSDKGHTWSGPVEIADRSFDQPRTTASLQDGKLRIYIAAASQGAVVLSSDDGGHSFQTGTRIEPDNLGHQAMNPLLLVDGSLLLPYLDFPIEEQHRLNFSRLYVARSEDGGRTFGVARFVADIARPYPGPAYFATDVSRGRFRGNIYGTWEEGDFGPRFVRRGGQLIREESGNRSEVVVARSTGNGRNWSVPKVLQAEGRGAAHFATLAVSQQGVLGVLWIQDERYESDARCYRVWFAASVDGGENFSLPTTVSDKVSCSDPKLNPEPYFKTRLKGGDYIGLAAAADGSFHAVWIDARDGAFRLYTARLEAR
jgi:BNR/Asp-box repeat